MNATVRYDRSPAPEVPASLANNGWSHDERVAAIEEILNRHGKPLTGPERDELASKSNLYLEARIEAGRAYEKRSGAADERVAQKLTREAKQMLAEENEGKDLDAEGRRLKANLRGDAAEEADAYARSVANLNGWRKDQAAEAEAYRKSAMRMDHASPPVDAHRGDAASEADAYARSIANLNSWRKDAAAAHQPRDHGGLPPSVPGRAPTPVDVRGDAASEADAYEASVANLNAWRNRA